MMMGVEYFRLKPVRAASPATSTFPYQFKFIHTAKRSLELMSIHIGLRLLHSRHIAISSCNTMQRRRQPKGASSHAKGFWDFQVCATTGSDCLAESCFGLSTFFMMAGVHMHILRLTRGRLAY
jgi:hypothetical protein